jgi:hypothetical protein
VPLAAAFAFVAALAFLAGALAFAALVRFAAAFAFGAALAFFTGALALAPARLGGISIAPCEEESVRR